MSVKTKSIFRTVLIMCMLFTIGHVYAQVEVKGNVIDATGEPIIGATVVEKGSANNATVTDFDGNFVLKVSGKNPIEISYIGMKTMTVDVKGKTVVNVKLEDDAAMLEEVVAIGYGTVRKKDLTGAVAQVGAKQIENIPVSDVSQALQGKLSGVNVTIADGAPDAETTIRVRGGGSLSQDNSPLYIVDGFEVADISDISPSEIETIDVLKDASSTAIYGAKGANGVIIVTTKSGEGSEGGKPKITVNGSWAWKTATKFVKTMSPYQYAYLKYQYLTRTVSDTQNYGYRTSIGSYADLESYKGFNGTDYQDEIFGRTGFQQQYNANISGGDKTLSYNVSYAHNQEKAIMRESGNTTNNLSGKLKWKVNKWITLDFNVRASFQRIKGLGSGADTNDNNASNSIVANAVKWSPLENSSADDDDLDQASSSSVDPLTRLLQTYKLQRKDKQNYNVGLTWKPIKHWTLKTEFSYKRGQKDIDQSWLAEATKSSKYNYFGTTQGYFYENRSHGWVSKNYITYDNKKLFKGRDAINVVFGTDLQSDSEKYTEFVGRDYNPIYNNDLQGIVDNKYDYRGEKLMRSIEEANVNMLSFYGRVNYTLMDKYLFTFVARADGSSRFASGHRWGFFPSGSVAWRVSDEDFLKDSKWISNLKLRLSFGTAGNNRIPSGLNIAYYSPAGLGADAPGHIGSTGIRPDMLQRNSTVPNSALKWETTITRNFGIDYGFWKGRINGSLEVYWNTTKDLLMQVKVPSIAGYGYNSYQYQNFGKTSNKGVELSLNVIALDTKRYNLKFNANIAYNKNKIEELNTFAGGWQSSSFNNVAYEEFKIEEGGALGEIWGYQSDGIYLPGQDITLDNSGNWNLIDATNGNKTYMLLGGTLYPGMMKVKDQNGDGKIDEQDKVRLGNTVPTWTGGFGLDFTWKNKWGNIDAAVFCNFSLGNEILNGTALANSYNNSSNLKYNVLEAFADCYRYIDAQGNNIGKPGTNMCSTYTYNGLTGTDAIMAALNDINGQVTTYNPIGMTSMIVTDRFVEKASYLRLQNVTIGYTFPKKLVKKLYLTNLRVYFTGYNLACITNYSGADPEVSTSKNLMCPGVDYSAYPKSRSYVAGINISF